MNNSPHPLKERKQSKGQHIFPLCEFPSSSRNSCNWKANPMVITCQNADMMTASEVCWATLVRALFKEDNRHWKLTTASKPSNSTENESMENSNHEAGPWESHCGGCSGDSQSGISEPVTTEPCAVSPSHASGIKPRLVIWINSVNAQGPHLMPLGLKWAWLVDSANRSPWWGKRVALDLTPLHYLPGAWLWDNWFDFVEPWFLCLQNGHSNI